MANKGAIDKALLDAAEYKLVASKAELQSAKASVMTADANHAAGLAALNEQKPMLKQLNHTFGLLVLFNAIC